MSGWIRLQRRLEEAVLAYGILAMAALMIGNVLTRTFLGFSLTFGEELSQFLIVTICFVGLSHAAGLQRHIRMTAFVEMLAGRPRHRAQAAIAVVTALLLLLLLVWSIRYVVVMADLGSVSPVLGVPAYLVYCVAPLGFALGVLRYLHQAVLWWRGDEATLARMREEGDEPTTATAH